MFTVYFKYVDGNEALCDSINKIDIETSSGYATISNEQILAYHFRPHGTMYLYSDTSNYSVSTHGLLYMEIREK